MTDTFDEGQQSAPDFDEFEDGQGDGLDGADETAEGDDETEGGEPEVEELNIDEVANRVVRIKVDGEEVAVPLSEALAGYQRQADYTRKTQELASQRSELRWAEALKGALDNDPKGTLELLQQHYGITPQQAAQQIADDPYGLGDFTEDAPAVDPRYSQLDARLRAFEEQQAMDRLQQEVTRLQTTYGSEFDAQEVVATALKWGSTDLEGVFKQIAFDRVAAKVKAAEAAQAKRAEKKTASVVSGGATAARRTSGDDGSVRSIADAWHAAKRELES